MIQNLPVLFTLYSMESSQNIEKILPMGNFFKPEQESFYLFIGIRHIFS